jgi:Permeases of the drug/metabolite transporter (DMT) superfamily
MEKTKMYWYHTMAIITVIIWGVTFVSTKVLINNGLTPVDIFIYRFVLAYICIWFVSPRKLLAKNIKDEVLFFFLGITGGSLYFYAENSALEITFASNVALILCTIPLVTTYMNQLFYKERAGKGFVLGSVIALIGVTLVIFNGSFILKLSPLGDILTLVAALMWAFYSIILKQLGSRYQALFITRKVFFYGLLTILPAYFIKPLNFDVEMLMRPAVIGNLLFLGIIASMLCYLMWNVSAKHLGPLRISNYLYIVPLVTMIVSAIVINETITLIAIIGSLFIIFGVYWGEKKIRVK